MVADQPTYRRLPGRGANLTHYFNLYQGEDCLMQVASTGWQESYKRFYYGDIQALIVRRTTTGAIITAVLAVLTTPCVAFALLGFEPVFMTAASLLFGLPLLYNLLAGPTCTCHIYTAVQAEKLPSLGRLRAVERVLQRIRPLIQQAQAPAPAPAQGAPPAPGSLAP